MSKMDIDSGFFGQAHRLHIDKIRARLEQLNCKTPGEQEVRLYKNEETKLAIIEIRSGAKNALSGRMISKLTEVIDQLYDWPQGRGVLICGYASTFCSGSDLIGVRETASLQWGLDLAAVMQYNMRRLQLLPMISVALVEGYALGGGAELACAADMRLFTGKFIRESNYGCSFESFKINYQMKFNQCFRFETVAWKCSIRP